MKFSGRVERLLFSPPPPQNMGLYARPPLWRKTQAISPASLFLPGVGVPFHFCLAMRIILLLGNTAFPVSVFSRAPDPPFNNRTGPVRMDFRFYCSLFFKVERAGWQNDLDTVRKSTPPSPLPNMAFSEIFRGDSFFFFPS